MTFRDTQKHHTARERWKALSFFECQLWFVSWGISKTVRWVERKINMYKQRMNCPYSAFTAHLVSVVQILLLWQWQVVPGLYEVTLTDSDSPIAPHTSCLVTSQHGHWKFHHAFSKSSHVAVDNNLMDYNKWKFWYCCYTKTLIVNISLLLIEFGLRNMIVNATNWHHNV